MLNCPILPLVVRHSIREPTYLPSKKMKRNVGILIFDDAEVLDFAGPFEVFAITSEINNDELFNVFTVGSTTQAIRAVNGLSVNPTYSFSNAPHIDILVVSGGSGTRQVIKDEHVLNWVRRTHLSSELTLSICSGARIFATLGLLFGKPYATHHEVYSNIQQIEPNGLPRPDRRFVNSGKLHTSGGISAGIDLSFHIVEQLHGEDIAAKTARYMEYERVRHNRSAHLFE